MCSPGGRLLVADIAADDDRAVAERFDEVERARDPSHQRALRPSEVITAMRSAGLDARHAATYQVHATVDGVLSRSASPDPERVRDLFQRALRHRHGLGVGEHRVGTAVHFAYPIAVIVGWKH